MAITKDFIGVHFGSEFLAWLEDKLVPDYVDSIEPNIGETEYSLILNGNTIARVTSSNWKLCSNSSSTSDKTCIANAAANTFGYTCKNGAAIWYCGTGSAASNRQGVILFTKDNSGETIVVASTILSSPTASYTTLTVCTDAFITHYANSVINLATELRATFNAGNLMCMTPFVCSTPDSSNRYTPNVFWCPMYQYAMESTLVINGTRYVSFGPWILKDE